MKVLILGSGVIGVALAYYLAKSGHEVIVVDRQPGPGLETSYANAGEVSPGYSAPWAAPGLPIKALKWAFMRHRPLVVWPKIDPAMWRWGLAMLRNCTAARYEINKNRMVRLAEYSRDCLRALRADTGIRYDERCLGTLQLFRTEQQLDGTGLSSAAFADMLRRVKDRAGEVPGSMQRIAAAARAHNVPMASHDDMTPAVQANYLALGCRICEFPFDRATAQAALARGA